MALNPKNQIQKDKPIILQGQSDPADAELAPGEFALYPKVEGGRVELFIKAKDLSGTVQVSQNLSGSFDENGDFQSYRRTVTVTNINNKYMELTPAPLNGAEVQVVVLGGIEQVNGIDFEILNGNQLSWASKGLEADLLPGDQLLIKYFG